MILGTAQLGMDYGVNNHNGQPSTQECFGILDAAKEGGINMLDTAEGYGASEKIIGDYLNKNPHAFDICTKLSVELENSISAVQENVKERLSALRTEQLSCCYLHRFEQSKNPKIIEGLVSAKEENLIERIGISIYEPSELEYISSGLSKTVDVVQIPINILSFAAWKEAMDDALSNGLILYARSVFLQGLFFMDPHSKIVSKLGASNLIHEIRKRASLLNISLAQYCYEFISSLPQIADVIVGCESKQQLQENLGYAIPPSQNFEPEREFALHEFSAIPTSITNPSKWDI